MTDAVYFIADDVLRRFDALFKEGERSGVVDRLIQQAIAEGERSLVAAARRIETDPALASIREVSDDVDAIFGETR